MNRLEEERRIFKEAWASIDNWDALATTLGCYPGMLRKRVEELERENQRYKEALETIEINTSDPAYDLLLQFLNEVAKDALIDDN